jgi:hypothetical protein
MIPEGNYKAKKVGGAFGYSKNDKEQAAILFELLDAGEYTGSQMTWHGYFTDRTEERTLKTLRGLGVSDDFSNIGEASDVECSLKIKHEEYEGKVSAKIAFVNFGGGLALARPMTDDQRKAFAAKMASKMRAVGEPQAAPATKGAYLPPAQRGDAYEGPEMPGDDFFGSADKAF